MVSGRIDTQRVRLHPLGQTGCSSQPASIKGTTAIRIFFIRLPLDFPGHGGGHPPSANLSSLPVASYLRFQLTLILRRVSWENGAQHRRIRWRRSRRADYPADQPAFARPARQKASASISSPPIPRLIGGGDPVPGSSAARRAINKGLRAAAAH